MTTRILLAALAIAIPAMGQTNVLASTPASLSFTWIEGSTLPVAQTTSISAGSSLAAYVTSPGAPWITVTPAVGTLPSALSVLVNPSGLAVGTYAAAIQVTATGFVNPIFIPVTVIVEAPLPTLVLSSSTLTFSTPPASPAPQYVTLTSTGGQPVTFSAAVQSTVWLTVSPSSGVVLPGLPITLTITANNTGLAPSATPYAGKISIIATGVVSTNKTQTIAVGLVVNALVPTITQLYPQAVLVGSQSLTVTVTGTGFYKGGTTASASAVPLMTTYVNPTTLSVVLPATLLATVGNISVTAVNPAPGGISIPSVFTVSLTPVVQALVSAASYLGGAVSPGEFVTLFGTGIGPVAPAGVTPIGGYAPFSLGGVSVSIDGFPAAMIYVSANQLTVQVPYGVTIGLARLVAVNNNGVAESYGPGVDTTATAPGLFLVSGVVGQCAALRYSSTGAVSVNSSTSAAVVGDTIVFYLTGEGIYDLSIYASSGYMVPPTLAALTLQTGQIAWPQLSPLPAVTIGGAAATVAYAGVVPGGLLGLLQVNAIVPAGSTKGNSVPVSITIGLGTTQAGATVALK